MENIIDISRPRRPRLFSVAYRVEWNDGVTWVPVLMDGRSFDRYEDAEAAIARRVELLHNPRTAYRIFAIFLTTPSLRHRVLDAPKIDEPLWKILDNALPPMI